MLKKTIVYKDFNDEEVSEDFYFHLSKAELIELELSHKGGLAASLQKIIDAEDGKSIIAEFKGIILGAYGVRSPDGKRFKKSIELREEFESSEAYSTLFVELVTDTNAAITFINGVIPADMAAEAARLAQAETQEDSSPKLVDAPKENSERETVTRAQYLKMEHEELQELNRRIQAGEVLLVDG